MKIKSHIWIEKEGSTFIGSGRVALLKAIQETGSMNKAAKSMNMSYKKAWTLIKSMDEMGPKPVVDKVIGGKGGGGAKLTDYGIQVVEAYNQLNKRCWEFLAKEEDKLLKEMGL